MHCSPINSLIPIPSSNNTTYLPCYFLGLDQQHYQGGGGMMSPIVGSGPYSSVSPGSFMMSPPQRSFKKTVRFEPTLGASSGDFDENNEGGVINNEKSCKSAPPAKKLPGPPIHGFGKS
jgi:hypothetical protein